MEKKLRDGTLLVRLRSVPGYASLQVSARFEFPSAPKVKVHSVAGHDELKDAPTDSPEWAEYAAKSAEVRKSVERAQNDFLYDYAVEAWSFDNGSTWHDDVSADWQFPAVLLRHGIAPGDNRRVDYIRYELITSNVDVAALFEAALGDAAPITDREVSAALGGFRTDKERRADTENRRKWYQRFQWAVQRNEHG